MDSSGNSSDGPVTPPQRSATAAEDEGEEVGGGGGGRGGGEIQRGMANGGGQRRQQQQQNGTPHRPDSSASSSSLFQQQFFHQQTNGHATHPAMGGFSSQMGPMGGLQQQPNPQNNNSAFPGNNEQQQAMHAFAAAAAANNLGLLCSPPSAPSSMPQFMPSGAFSLANYGQRAAPPTAQHLQQSARPAGGTPLRKQNGCSALASSQSAGPSATPSASSSSSINRSQRCGVCRGCQCKPCGQCTYCQDSPQFGGPGVKKQSCIERRCLRVLENRLQRDAPTFKARIGCGACEDCRSADCQICLVCLDKRFFHGRYMCGALCAKKRCNNATSLELPCALDRTTLKRPSCDRNNVAPSGGTPLAPHHHPHPSAHHQQQQQMAKRLQLVHSPAVAAANPNCANLNSNIARILSAAQHDGGRAQTGGNYGRSSGGNSTTNSPMSEGADGTPPGASGLPQQVLQFAAASGRPLCWPPSASPAPLAHPPLMPLGVVPYSSASFDQQMAASLAAAAAAGGFPAPGQPQHSFPSVAAPYYSPKFLATTAAAYHPKYEYFEESGGAAGIEGGARDGTNQPGGVAGETNPQQNGAAPSTNPFVPPSYSAERKVVLQPL